MKRQEAFNIVWNGLKSQGFVRAGTRENCAYRDSCERKCAIGWLLTDEEYFPEMEGLGVRKLRKYRMLPNRLKSLSTEFLSYLQVVHDENDTPAHMRSALEYAAERFNLEVPK